MPSICSIERLHTVRRAQINGLTVGVIDLALQVPLNSLTDTSTWSLDLEGFAVALDADPVEISGGLSKNPGPPVEYDGMLSVTVEDIGFSIVAAYSRPSDAQGAYTSLFMFVALDIPLGGPPFRRIRLQPGARCTDRSGQHRFLPAGQRDR